MAAGQDMGEQIFAVVMQTTKLSANTFFKAVTEQLAELEKKQNAVHAERASPKRKEAPRGKQSLKELSKGGKVQNIEVNKSNLRSFKKSADKYCIDFAIKKMPDEKPPKYVVFFKAKDLDQVNLAFSDYVKKQTKQKGKQSIRKKVRSIQQDKNRNERSRQREKKKNKDMQL